MNQKIIKIITEKVIEYAKKECGLEPSGEATITECDLFPKRYTVTIPLNINANALSNRFLREGAVSFILDQSRPKKDGGLMTVWNANNIYFNFYTKGGGCNGWAFCANIIFDLEGNHIETKEWAAL